MLATEPFPFIMWWIALADIYAILTGNGNGEFVRTVLRKGLLPEARDLLPPLYESSPRPFHYEEQEAFPSALELLRGIAVAAASLGQLSREFRGEALQPTPAGEAAPSLELDRRRGQLFRVQEDLRRTWRAHHAAMSRAKPSMAAEALPDRVQATLDQVW